MPNLYKVRLAALGLTQTSILPKIRDRMGTSVNTTELSAAITGAGTQNKHKCILKALDELLEEYERG